MASASSSGPAAQSSSFAAGAGQQISVLDDLSLDTITKDFQNDCQHALRQLDELIGAATDAGGAARAQSLQEMAAKLREISSQKFLTQQQSKLDGAHPFTACFVGATGCGKSTFINALIGAALLPNEYDVGERLGSVSYCPSEVTLYPVASSNGSVRVVVHLPSLPTVLTRLQHVEEMLQDKETVPDDDRQALDAEQICLFLLQRHIEQAQAAGESGDSITVMYTSVKEAARALHQLRSTTQMDPEGNIIEFSDKAMHLGLACSLLRRLEVHLPVPQSSHLASLKAPICLVDLPGLFDVNELRSAATAAYIDSDHFYADLFCVLAPAVRSAAKAEVADTYRAIMTELNSRVAVQMQCVLVFTFKELITFVPKEKRLPQNAVKAGLDKIKQLFAAKDAAAAAAAGKQVGTPDAGSTRRGSWEMQDAPESAASSSLAATAASSSTSATTPKNKALSDEEEHEQHVKQSLALSARWLMDHLPKLADIRRRALMVHSTESGELEEKASASSIPSAAAAAPSAADLSLGAVAESADEMMPYFGCATRMYCERVGLQAAKGFGSGVTGTVEDLQAAVEVKHTGVPDVMLALNDLRRSKHREALLQWLGSLFSHVDSVNQPTESVAQTQTQLQQQVELKKLLAADRAKLLPSVSALLDVFTIKLPVIVPTPAELVQRVETRKMYTEGSGSWKVLDTLFTSSRNFADLLLKLTRERLSPEWNELFEDLRRWIIEIYTRAAHCLQNVLGSLDLSTQRRFKHVQSISLSRLDSLRVVGGTHITAAVVQVLAAFKSPPGGRGYASNLYQKALNFVRTTSVASAVTDSLQTSLTQLRTFTKEQITEVAAFALKRFAAEMRMTQQSASQYHDSATKLLLGLQQQLCLRVPNAQLPKLVVTDELDDESMLTEPTRTLSLAAGDVPVLVSRMVEHFQLLESEFMGDGFYWIPWLSFPPGAQLPSLAQLRDPARLNCPMPLSTQPCEFLIFDARNDVALAALVDEVRSEFKTRLNSHYRARYLQKLVHDRLGGDVSRMDLVPTNLRAALLMKEHGSPAVPIGGFLKKGSDGSAPTGCCRHRALLFKYLGDVTASGDVPTVFRSRVIFGRVFSRVDPKVGGPHAWNVYLEENSPLVIDSMWEPTVYPLSLKINRVAEFFRGPPHAATGTSGAFSNTETTLFRWEDFEFETHVDQPIVGGQSLVWKCWLTVAKLAERGGKLGPNDRPDSAKVAVALKLFRVPIQSAAGESSKAFRAELATLAHLSHPNIVHFYGRLQRHAIEDRIHPPMTGHRYGRDGVVTEWRASGKSLLHFANHASQVEQSVRMSQVWRIAEQLASAVLHMHTGPRCIVHRDLSPDNVMWDPVREQLTLLDFGLARILSIDGTLMSVEHRVGKDLWRDPAMDLAGPNATLPAQVARCGDTYSFGLLLLFLVSGLTEDDFRHNISLGNMHGLIQSVPSRLLAGFIQKCMTRDITARPDFNSIYRTILQVQFHSLASLLRTKVKQHPPQTMPAAQSQVAAASAVSPAAVQSNAGEESMQLN